jgi:membrane protease YdiL (CAAX protease family)
MDAAGPRGGAPGAEDRAPLTPPRWGALRLAITATGSFVAATVVSTAAAIALGLRTRPPQQRTPEEILLLAVLTDAALLVALFALGRRLLGLRLADLGFRRPSAGVLGFAVGVAAGLWLLSISVNALQIRAFGANPQSLVITVGAHSGLAALIMDLAAGAVIAPFAEEVLYRGLVFGGLAQRMPLHAAGAISALLFALSHGLGVVAPIFVLGLGLAWVYARTGTIWAPMATHAVVNAISLLLLFAVPR